MTTEISQHSKSSQRDVRVELMRVVGCLIVIGCHVNPLPSVDGHTVPSRVLLAAIFADGVSVFWFISGFFLFKKSFDYARTLRRTARKIIAPTFLFLAFEYYFRGTVVYGEPLSQSVAHPLSDYVHAVKQILILDLPVPNCGHLWFLMVYFVLIGISPVVNAFALWLAEDRKREDGFLGITAMAFFINTVTLNATFDFSFHSLAAAIPAATIALWGNIFYRRYREVDKHNKRVWISIAGFLVLAMLRAVLQYRCYVDNVGGASILRWWTIFGIATACLVGMACICAIVKYDNSWKSWVIRMLATHTFTIYLVQNLVQDVLIQHGITSTIQLVILNGTKSWWRTCAYDAVMMAIVFAVCLTISVLLHAAIRMVNFLLDDAE